MERKDITLKELIALFKDEPLDFAPGEDWSYSNSGYVLLGAIIEQVSGLSYSEFMQQCIFAPLGMEHSYYDDPTQLILGRVTGYSRSAQGYVNAAYMSMSHPYVSGALSLFRRRPSALGRRTIYRQANKTNDYAPCFQALSFQER